MGDRARQDPKSCGQLTDYYNTHRCKKIYYYHDKCGDSRNPNLLNSMSYNHLVISYFKKAGWEVLEHAHKGVEPTQSDKYLLWGLINPT